MRSNLFLWSALCLNSIANLAHGQTWHFPYAKRRPIAIENQPYVLPATIGSAPLYTYPAAPLYVLQGSSGLPVTTVMPPWSAPRNMPVSQGQTMSWPPLVAGPAPIPPDQFPISSAPPQFAFGPVATPADIPPTIGAPNRLVPNYGQPGYVTTAPNNQGPAITSTPYAGGGGGGPQEQIAQIAKAAADEIYNQLRLKPDLSNTARPTKTTIVWVFNDTSEARYFQFRYNRDAQTRSGDPANRPYSSFVQWIAAGSSARFDVSGYIANNRGAD